MITIIKKNKEDSEEEFVVLNIGVTQLTGILRKENRI